jgi:hypothetical protein
MLNFASFLLVKRQGRFGNLRRVKLILKSRMRSWRMIRVPRPAQLMSPLKNGQSQAQKGAQINPPAADILTDCDHS